MNLNVLTPQQQEVTRRVLEEEQRGRVHLVISLSGAHAYGFPSHDSDLDLKAVHIEPTQSLLGLRQVKTSASRLETIDGVEIDYSTNEIHPVLLGILQGNGNYIERILGALVLGTSSEHEALRPIVRRSLSRRVYKHYAGFATGQFNEFQAAEAPTAKKVLYVLRTTLTGSHLLRTGEMVIDVTRLLDEYGFAAARELVDAKRTGERAVLTDAARGHWVTEVKRAFTALEEAHASSVLPEESTNRQELEGWLIELRRARL
jgi:predicted nucleotidyltransferase